MVLSAGGCTFNEAMASVGSKSVPYQEYTIDPVALTKITTIAVLPFDDRSPTAGFKGELFAVALANQLGGHGQFRVIFPREFLDRAETHNRAEERRWQDLRARNRLGLPLDEAERAHLREGPRPRLDPVKNLETALRLARQMKADAVITGYAADFDPAMRPRLTINYTLTATGAGDGEFGAVAAMTSSGVPHGMAGNHPRGTVYVRQQVFDTREGNVNNKVRKFTTLHVMDNYPDGYGEYLKSMPHYYDFCASVLAESLAKAKSDALREVARENRNRVAAAPADPDAAARRRLAERRARDFAVPDTERPGMVDDYAARRYPAASHVLEPARVDDRIRSWRPDEARWAIRQPLPEERVYRDDAGGRDGRDPAQFGYAPSGDVLLDQSPVTGPDESWRPAVYNAANPDKLLRLAESEGRRGTYD